MKDFATTYSASYDFHECFAQVQRFGGKIRKECVHLPVFSPQVVVPSSELTSLGRVIFPFANIFMLLLFPSESIQRSQSAPKANAILFSSPEYISSGQYSPTTLLGFLCERNASSMQYRHVRNFLAFVVSERWVGFGKNPHFGCSQASW